MHSETFQQPFDDSGHDVRRLPRDSWARRIFFLGALALATGLAWWILWLLASVE